MGVHSKPRVKKIRNPPSVGERDVPADAAPIRRRPPKCWCGRYPVPGELQCYDHLPE
jgi:hypothetical protein